MNHHGNHPHGKNILLGSNIMNPSTIRITPSMMVSPKKHSVYVSVEELPKRLLDEYKNAFEILPMDCNTKVRLFYDLDGATEADTEEAFNDITDDMDMCIKSFKLDGVAPVIYTSHKYQYQKISYDKNDYNKPYIKEDEPYVNKLSYRLYFPNILMSVKNQKATLGEFKMVLEKHFDEAKNNTQILYAGDTIMNSTHLTIDPSVYSTERKMRLPYQSKDGDERPLIPTYINRDTILSDIQDAFITYYTEEATDYNGKTLPTQKTIVVDEETLPTKNVINESQDEVEQLCDLLDEKWVSSYENWIRLLFCLKTLGEKYRNTFLDVSKRCKKYNNKATIRENMEKWDTLILKDCRITLGSLKHWAKKCNPVRYFELRKTTYKSLIETIPLTSNELCEVFSIDMAGDIMYSESQKEFYIFNHNNGLWENRTIHSIFTSRIQHIVQKLIADLPVAESEGDIASKKKKMKTYMDAMDLCDGYKLNNLLARYLPSFCSSSEDPIYFLNTTDNFLNLKNGVWDFKNKVLVPYDRNHYFTFKLDVEYKADADTSDIHKAFELWFKKDKDVMSFVRYWLGYCLTGYTDRQEILFVWGESAGNGKSTLFNELMGGLLGEQKLMEILSTTDIRNKGDNNEGLYRLNGKRFAIISEPSKNVRGAVEFDNDLMKNISGDKTISAQAKYKNKITFRNTSKIGFIFNELPEINFEDKGMFRRMVILEMNVSFKSDEEYERCPQHLKEGGIVQKRDSHFIRRVIDNKEGFLKYLLEGAAEFVEERESGKLRSIPPSMKNTKDKAVSELDTLGGWLDSWLEYEEGAKLRKSDLLHKWKSDRLDFGQGVKGFVNRLKSKCGSRGYGWDDGAKGKGREVILNATLRIDTEVVE
jgi:P4 family phage/plasmid primase-like protien